MAAYESHEGYTETARQLDIAQATAYGIIRRYQQHGVVARPRGGARNTRLDTEMIDEIVSVIEEHPEYTLIQINTELRRRLPHKPRVCENSIANALNGRVLRDAPTGSAKFARCKSCQD